ncbi:MAG: ABC transporter permease, partial [Deltaproteobacteria bacterium]|nr:ABC transporter permease [Deltaproteobacteria bacterium]
GGLLGLLFAFLTVSLGVNQIVVGIGLTIFAHSACSFLHRVIFGNQFPIIFGAGGTNPIPVLCKIPIIGPSLFSQHWMVYVTILLVPVLFYLMYRTSLGLRVRAVGDTPWAADASGVSVFRTRYFTAILGGALAGLGGAFMAIGDLAFFVPDMVQGRGYIAIVIVMLGKWNPLKVFFGSLLFGFALSLTSALQLTGINISPDFILMMPYVVVILTLVIFARSTSLPAALCIPYQRGEK